MEFRILLAVVVVVVACRSAVAEPKAYEVVKYKGKAEGITFALDYGDGYPDASEMKVTDRKSGKSTRFGLDDSSEMRFVPAKQDTGKREIVLKMNRNGGRRTRWMAPTRSTASRRNSRFGESISRFESAAARRGRRPPAFVPLSRDFGVAKSAKATVGYGLCTRRGRAAPQQFNN